MTTTGALLVIAAVTTAISIPAAAVTLWRIDVNLARACTRAPLAARPGDTIRACIGLVIGTVWGRPERRTHP